MDATHALQLDRIPMFDYINWSSTLRGLNLSLSTEQDKGFVIVEARKRLGFIKLRLQDFSGQYYKAYTIINYDFRVVPDLKIPHITTLES